MKTISSLLVVLIMIISGMSFIDAANIGISPASIAFEQVLRGGFSERTVTVTVDSENIINIEVTPYGDIASWLNFSETTFNVSKDNPHILSVSVNPPEDVPNGNYTGFVRITTSALGEGIEGHAVSVVRSALDLATTVEITDVEIKECDARSFKVDSVEKGDDIVFEMQIQNQGNVRFKPLIKVDIWDMDQINIVKSQEFSEQEVLPSLKDTFRVRMKSSDMGLGQYWADVTAVDCLSSDTLTFDVLEEGALKAEGKLARISTAGVSNIKDTTPIEIDFDNTGEKEVEAQFKGKITLGQDIVQILESESARVPVSESNRFTFYFTPEKAGKYVVSGRVYYSGKKTFEGSATLDAIAGESKYKQYLVFLIYILIYLGLAILIIILFLKIRKEKRSLRSKFDRIK